MPKTPVFEHEKITVWCDPEKRLIHHEMHSSCTGETFRHALNAGLEAMREHHAHRWLSDDRKHNALAPDDEEWAQRVWFPQAQAAGWKHWAVMQPESALGQMSNARFRQWNSKHGINSKLFTDLNEALRWLLSQD